MLDSSFLNMLDSIIFGKQKTIKRYQSETC